MTGTDISARARAIHASAWVVDAHADTPTEVFREPGYDFGRRMATGHVDLPRLREGGVDVQFLVSWVPAELAAIPGASFAHAIELVEAIHRVVERTPGVRIATDSAGIHAAREAGEVAVMIGVEGGHAIENSLDNLRRLHDRGARYLTLTWNNANDWADASMSPPRHGGLTPFGRDVVRELNRLRMLVDVSHVSDDTFDDVLAVSSAPVIASHSGARAIADHRRNLSDRQLRDLARAGGVVGVNFFPAFLDEAHGRAFDRIEAEARALEARLLASHGDVERARRDARAWRGRELARLPQVPASAIADHIDHIVQVAGIDHVGLGSDFDGIATVPSDLPDVSALPRLTEILLRRGYDEAAVGQVLGGNFLRVIGLVLG
jgi:membrane dipeptidase